MRVLRWGEGINERGVMSPGVLWLWPRLPYRMATAPRFVELGKKVSMLSVVLAA